MTGLLSCGILAAQADATLQVPVAAPDKQMFAVLPNYRTADGTLTFQTLTPAQKFTIAEHDSFDPPGYFIAAWYTGIYHLEKHESRVRAGRQGLHAPVRCYL